MEAQGVASIYASLGCQWVMLDSLLATSVQAVTLEDTAPFSSVEEQSLAFFSYAHQAMYIVESECLSKSVWLRDAVALLQFGRPPVALASLLKLGQQRLEQMARNLKEKQEKKLLRFHRKAESGSTGAAVASAISGALAAAHHGRCLRHSRRLRLHHCSGRAERSSRPERSGNLQCSSREGRDGRRG